MRKKLLRVLAVGLAVIVATVAWSRQRWPSATVRGWARRRRALPGSPTTPGSACRSDGDGSSLRSDLPVPLTRPR
jgi:hypothetical protein